MQRRKDSRNRNLLAGEYQKPDGRYEYRYTDADGVKRSVYSWTLTQTDRAPEGREPGQSLRELELQIEADKRDRIDSRRASALTLNSAFRSYMDCRKDLKDTTRGQYRLLYKTHVKDSIGERKLADIRYSDIKRLYINAIEQSGLKLQSVKSIDHLLHPVFETAVRDGLIRTNPTSGVTAELGRTYGHDRRKRHALTIPEQRALLEFVGGHPVYRKWKNLLVFLLGTGCRIGEAGALTWDDCDFKRSAILVKHSLSYTADEYTGKYSLHVNSPKTKAGVRTIPMLSEVKNSLLETLEWQKRESVSGFVLDGYSGFVFTTRDGTPQTQTNFDHALSKIEAAYNEAESAAAVEENRDPLLMPHLSPHILRHTFCTRICENETNLKVIQEIMGHSDISVTMNIYNEATMDSKRKSFANLEGKIV